MHFRGTRNRTPSIFARDLGTIGGIVESRVEFDHTAHDMVAPSAQWKKVLELEADALLNPLAHDGEFERAFATSGRGERPGA